MRRRRHKQKRARQTKVNVRPKIRGRFQIVILAIVVALLTGLFLVAAFSRMGWIGMPGERVAESAWPVPDAEIITEFDSPRIRAGNIIIPAATVEDSTVRFFEFRSAEGPAIRFLITHTDDGRDVATLDTCRECIEFREGYTLVGQNLICRTCGRATPLDAIGVEGDRCRPIVLASDATPHELRIRIEDLKRSVAP